MTQGRPAAGLVRVGRVGRPHGVRGGFYVDGSIGREAFAVGISLVIGDREFAVLSSGGTDARPLVSLEGLVDREQTAALRGESILAARDDLPPLKAGEWYAADLEGLTVVGTDRVSVGVVIAMVNTPSVDVLEVEPVGGGLVLQVPMIHDAISQIDVRGGRVIVDRDFLGIA